MRRITLFIALSLAVSILAYPRYLSAQSFEEKIAQMIGENAEMYVQPLVTAFGSDINSGLYHTAKTHSLGGFDFGLRAMIAFVPGEDETFTPTLGDPFDITVDGYTVTLDPEELYGLLEESPTIVGDEERPGEIEADDDYILQELQDAGYPGQELPPGFEIPNLYLPGGVGITTIPLLVPQVSVGLLYGTEVMLRYVPPLTLSEDIGDISMFGLGVSHSVSQWIPVPMFPVDIAAQFMYQRLKIGDILTATNTNFNIHVSKSLPMIGVYGGLGYDSSTVDMEYVVDSPGHPLDGEEYTFSVDGKNGFRTTVGANFSMLFLNLNVDYTLAKHSVATAGLSFKFM